jgi:hypothetical protein
MLNNQRVTEDVSMEKKKTAMLTSCAEKLSFVALDALKNHDFY